MSEDILKVLHCKLRKTLYALDSTYGVYSTNLKYAYQRKADDLCKIINLIESQNLHIKVLEESNEALQNDLINANMNLEHLTEELKQREWVSISERLPPEHKESRDIYDIYTLAVIDTEHFTASDLVNVTVRDYEKDELFVCDDCTVDGKWSNFGNDRFEVLAWCNLPPIYKEADNE